MGITTALEFKQADPSAIRKSMGVVGERMLRELNGIPCLELEETSPDRKGVMASRSFGSAVESLEELEEALANHVARASEKIRRHGLLATRLEVFLQTNRFSPEEPRHFPSAGESLQRPTASTAELIATALALLGSIHRPGYRYKKTGIRLTGLVREKNHQPCLELEPVKPSRRIDVDAIVDAINARLGDPRHPVITRAAMGTLSSKKTWVMRSSLRSPRYTTSLKELPVVRA
jgi:DNA polymerase V